MQRPRVPGVRGVPGTAMTPAELVGNALQHMTPAELVAYARGYVDGWNRGDDNAEWRDHTEQIREALRRSEAAGHRRAWDQAVLRGENPTPFTTEEST